MTSHSLFENAEIVHSYTRKQAIKDGVLVDVTETAGECGFKIPVALTLAVFDQFVDWSEADNDRQTSQDTRGRLLDLLSMLHMQCNRHEDIALFVLSCIPRCSNSKRQTPVRVTLKALCHGGDKGEPVITIMLPNED